MVGMAVMVAKVVKAEVEIPATPLRTVRGIRSVLAAPEPDVEVAHATGAVRLDISFAIVPSLLLALIRGISPGELLAVPTFMPVLVVAPNPEAHSVAPMSGKPKRRSRNTYTSEYRPQKSGHD